MNREMTVIVLLSLSILTWNSAEAEESGIEQAGCDTLGACVEAKRVEYQTRGTVGMLIHPLAVTEEGYGRWRVRRVMPEGPAANAGLQPEDVLLSWNGKPLPRDNESGMTGILRAIRIDEELELEVARADATMKVKLVAEGPSADAIEYWLLVWVRENYSEEEFQTYEASVQQRLVHANQP